jgi:hypothetical protein
MIYGGNSFILYNVYYLVITMYFLKYMRYHVFCHRLRNVQLVNCPSIDISKGETYKN